MTPEIIRETSEFIQNQLPDFEAKIGIILGTGLGHLAQEIEVLCEIPYHVLPHFPISTVETHSGKLILGTLGGKSVICLQGRFHYYEGYSMQEVTFPIRVLHSMGVKYLFVSNAAGGLNPAFNISDLMIIEDHVALFLPESPLRGKNPASFGPRFPDMSQPYDLELINQGKAILKELGVTLHSGVYTSVQGPQLETKAEYRLLRQLGTDAVGMSTVPEVIVAHQVGMKVFACSVITDLCFPETLKEAKFEEILAAAAKAEPHLTQLFIRLIQQIS
ncbi:purine-nucleoside phosphorylase [Siphonobacter sp. SORGH_AS_1065]|uniref:purine-nucleoside phosphorylase n=1 Tax=Siphonobacter sp. SORGH_AS_1065 TaxID=3041795 RepID=UPI0027810704|nr:purine-nucleoside phosphorylase [Siphonobacter sp. SORGH_AS_1065]MDQ1088755.1 purine-nucleoside phosphorylase [Siphonobacter sp. SORGH_AS_1065]